MVSNLVQYAQLTRGDEFMVEHAVWVTKAVDLPGNGEVVIWATDPQGGYHTLYRRSEELAECPTYG